MSTNKKRRSECAKDSASDVGASKKASARGRKDGNGQASEFQVLPKSVGLDQHMAYMEEHTGAIKRSMRVNLGGSWCVGYELTRIKEKLGLKGEKWDAHCKKVLPFSSRQARDYTVLAKAYGSAEEMIAKVGEETSFANAVLAARALVNPDPTPEPTPDKTGEGTGGGNAGRENNPVTLKPGDGSVGGNGSPTDDRTPPAPGSKGAGMLDDIIRIAFQFADDRAPRTRVRKRNVMKWHGRASEAPANERAGKQIGRS